MSTLGKITRRGLLLGAVAVAGGAAFGIYQVQKPVENPLSPDQGATLNPYVIIDRSGVTIIAPRAEMGQGVHTTLAALVAEELDVDWTSIRVEHGPPSSAYYNAALMHGALPVADYAMKDWQHSVVGGLGAVAKLLGLQVTGGSTSTVDAYEKMRYAGAGAREALKAVAADRLGVALASLRTESGFVIAPDNSRISYADLAEEAATRPVPDVTLRPQSEWKLLGRALPRSDMRAKITGQAQYATDIALPGLKFATVRICPYLGGGMARFDPAPALALPGVEQVIDMGNGVAVVARNTWAAMEGARAVDVQWTPSPLPADMDGMFAAIEAAFDAEPNSTLRDDGDVATLPEGAIRADYRVPFLAHSTMEPQGATAWLQDGRMTIWAGNQAPRLCVQKAAEASGLTEDAITLHTAFMGGGFGRRAETDTVAQVARIAAEMSGTPIRLTWSREEDMGHDFYRPAAMARMQGAVADGRISHFNAAIAAPSVTRASMKRIMGRAPGGADKGHVEGAFDQPYAIPNYRVAGHLADLDVPIGFWRSVGASFNGFFHESFVDELAHAAGADPLAFRLAHVAPESAVAARVLERVREISGWDTPLPEGRARGIAMTWSFGTPTAVVIELARQGDRIRIDRAFMACDPGLVLDPGIVRAQMESGLIYGLSAAVMGEITFTEGRADQANFPDYDALRMFNTPRIEVAILNTNPHMGGVGEPGTPPAIPALANALFALTGTRARSLPLRDVADFGV
ncbi:MAG: xanthine dehydrogenase family protein molybdopterin-binding subunit [Rhodobacteraceae bacterium]|nr:xanthine dehydrogenase family protein molybdopterin-binding subunit [Paracoccaceae bacterium]